MATVSGDGHVPGHAGIALDCPVSCLGVGTVADLLRLLAEAGRLTAHRAHDAGTLEVLPHVHERVTPSCPVFCLKLSRHVLNRLRCHHEDKPETVGDLLRLLQTGRLADIRNVGPRRVGEVRTALIAAGFSASQYPVLGD